MHFWSSFDKIIRSCIIKVKIWHTWTFVYFTLDGILLQVQSLLFWEMYISIDHIDVSVKIVILLQTYTPWQPCYTIEFDMTRYPPEYTIVLKLTFRSLFWFI